VFGPKDSPAGVVEGLSNPNHHDPWNRLHGGPSGFAPGPSWTKGPDERDRAKDMERRDGPHIKDEKDRYDIIKALMFRGNVLLSLRFSDSWIISPDRGSIQVHKRTGRPAQPVESLSGHVILGGESSLALTIPICD